MRSLRALFAASRANFNLHSPDFSLRRCVRCSVVVASFASFASLLRCVERRRRVLLGFGALVVFVCGGWLRRSAVALLRCVVVFFNVASGWLCCVGCVALVAFGCFRLRSVALVASCPHSRRVQWHAEQSTKPHASLYGEKKGSGVHPQWLTGVFSVGALAERGGAKRSQL